MSAAATIHDEETFRGGCEDCNADIAVGKRCPPCAVKSLARADLALLAAEHGAACMCLTCIKARAAARGDR